MDEEQKTPEETQAVETPVEEKPQPAKTSPSENVSFSPLMPKQAKPKSLKTFLIVFIIAIFIIGGFLIFRDKKQGTSEENPTPLARGVSIEATSTPLPTATPKPIDKTKVSIEIQNGTGITGEAAFLKDLLKSLGYSKFTVGNAEKQDNVTTSITYSKELSETAQTEITAKLKETYKEVDVKTSATAKVDVLIVTGLRKGATAKPSASPTAKPSATPSASPTATSSPSPTPA